MRKHNLFKTCGCLTAIVGSLFLGILILFVNDKDGLFERKIEYSDYGSTIYIYTYSQWMKPNIAVVKLKENESSHLIQIGSFPYSRDEELQPYDSGDCVVFSTTYQHRFIIKLNSKIKAF